MDFPFSVWQIILVVITGGLWGFVLLMQSIFG